MAVFSGTADRPRYTPSPKPKYAGTVAPRYTDSSTGDLSFNEAINVATYGSRQGAGNGAGPGLGERPSGGLNENPLDFLHLRPDAIVPPGGGSPSGGGGGGGGGGVSPQVRSAYQALWNQQFGNAAGVNQGWDQYENRMRGVFAPSKVNSIYDTAQTGVQGASKAGLDRLAPIMQALSDRAAQGRTAVSDAYAQGDARLRGIGSQAQAGLAAQAGAVNSSLGAFDAGTVAPTGGDSLNNLVANARVANNAQRTAQDAALADRPAVYEGLNADVTSGISRDESGLLSRIAMQRAAAQQQAQQQLETLLAQAGLGRMRDQQAQQQQQNDLRITLAELGMIPPSSFTGSWG